MEIFKFKSQYTGLPELFGLPAVGKTTFIANQPQLININERSNHNFFIRYSLKIVSVFRIAILNPKYFIRSIIFLKSFDMNLKDKLRLLVNLLRVVNEGHININNGISDQGFFQSLWSIGVYSHNSIPDVEQKITVFLKQNPNFLPKEITIISDTMENNLSRETQRYGYLKTYYENNQMINRSISVEKIIIDIVSTLYIKVG